MLYLIKQSYPNFNFDFAKPTFNTLRPRLNGRHFADDVFKCIFLNENVWILLKISLKFVPKGPINNISSLVQIMAWRRPGDKPLSKPMMVSLRTHICVTRPQWVKLWHQWAITSTWNHVRIYHPCLFSVNLSYKRAQMQPIIICLDDLVISKRTLAQVGTFCAK